MSLFSKIVIFLLIILLSFCTCSFATDINMNVINSISYRDNIIDYSNNTEHFNYISNNAEHSNGISSYNTIDSSTEGTLSQTKVSSVSKDNIDDGLSLSNILNILLIVVGIVLILLSVAILIRLHS